MTMFGYKSKIGNIQKLRMNEGQKQLHTKNHIICQIGPMKNIR